MNHAFVILLVEDNPADVDLTQIALVDGKLHHELYVARDGVEAMAFLNHEEPFTQAPRPDLILLDLNLPRKDGREVLVEIKTNPAFMRIPVIILTVSQAEDDILESYNQYANGYIVKPVDIEQFFKAIKQIREYWVSIAVLPGKTAGQ